VAPQHAMWGPVATSNTTAAIAAPATGLNPLANQTSDCFRSHADHSGARARATAVSHVAIYRSNAASEVHSGAPQGSQHVSASFGCMTNDELATFYRRYNTCCNEHRVEELAEFVARNVAIDGTLRSLDAYADELRTVVRAFPDYRWELRHLVVDAPWIAAHFTDTGTHLGTFHGIQATGRSVAVPEFAFYRVDAGRIVEVWGSAFHLHLLAELR
jgi:predicted ester cyclase